VIIEDYRENNDQIAGLYLPEGSANISFTIKNEGSISETFDYDFSDVLGWFDSLNGSVDIGPGEKETITFNGTTFNNGENSCQFQVTPTNKPSMTKSVNTPLFLGALNIDENNSLVPESIFLLPPYPNPFNPHVNIRVKNGRGFESNIEIYDISGRIVKNISLDNMHNDFEYNWNATGESSGLYFIRLLYNNQSQIQKVLYLK
jgi:hypothetical protein